jgi:putative CocE/NonD family hydrolase
VSLVLRSAAAVALLAVAACGAPQSPGPAAVSSARPAGWSDLSYYVPMKDGVRLALSLWFPEGRSPDSKLPTVLVQTRYGRAGVFIYGEGGRYRKLRDSGYAVAIVDTRGSTSSFGHRLVEIGPEEVGDMNTLVEHIRSRTWSDGRVVATGVSYMADTADIATAVDSHIDAAVVRQADFDGYLGLFAPGGVANDMMMNLWGGATIPRDYGRGDSGQDLDCALRAADCARLFPRLQPVDADPDYALLRQAFKGRRHWRPEDYRFVDFRSDKAGNGYTMLDSSPARYLEGMRRQRVPVQYWGSWMDSATADAAIARYRSTPDVPVEIWITANDHSGEKLTDPFFPTAAPLPSTDDQWTTIQRFFADSLARRPAARAIHYYVLGTREFRTTPVWPPADVREVRLPFGPSGQLLPEAAPAGIDSYEVDFAASTGPANRWSTQIGTPARYEDRRAEDRKLLAYTSEPFEKDMEVVGTPVVRLSVATDSADPAFFAYLSDVAPDGTVTYLTEGQFRALHRRPAGQAELPYVQPEPAHSFDRAHATPVVPGEVFTVEFPLLSVAARIRAGHRIRVSLAGADSSTFRRYPAGAAERWRIFRGPGAASSLQFTIRPWAGR